MMKVRFLLIGLVFILNGCLGDTEKPPAPTPTPAPGQQLDEGAEG